jgi:hypothetical protein
VLGEDADVPDNQERLTKDPGIKTLQNKFGPSWIIEGYQIGIMDMAVSIGPDFSNLPR